jgi:acetyltransferase-like isoleucine patch superfamily enzyme
MIKDLLDKRHFDISADRLGPDCPFTHWRLYFKRSMSAICKNKFKSFSEGAEFRPGAYAVTCSKISLGKNVIIRPNTMIFADPREGDPGSVILEDNVMLGSGVHIYVANHEFTNPNIDIIKQGHRLAQSVVLQKGAWVGANAIILAGVTIGKNSVVGAGSIVTKSIPDYCIAVGSPAKVVREITR